VVGEGEIEVDGEIVPDEMEESEVVAGRLELLGLTCEDDFGNHSANEV
jgi:hypothetical protein